MKRLALALFIAGLAVFGAALWLNAYCQAPLSLLLPYGIAAWICLGFIAGLIGIAFYPIEDLKGRWPVYAAWATPGIGLGATLVQELNVWDAVVQTHTNNFQVYGPGIASALLPFGLGLVASAAAVLRLALNQPNAVGKTFQ